eukprot:GDKI01025694.1.p1 GENE.GDKI01025694.1~~GDKI01025694.1.p1  ORF type:complete len:168 (-),score=31.01 GDKI01025694.1:110-547(-)
MGYFDAVKLLMERGADVTLAENDGMTPLFHAADQGHSEICTYIIRKDWRQAKSREPVTGETALHFAAKQGHQATVIALLDTIYCEHDAKDNRGIDAAFLAKVNGHYHIAEAIDLWLKKQAEDEANSFPIPDELIYGESRGGKCMH